MNKNSTFALWGILVCLLIIILNNFLLTEKILIVSFEKNIEKSFSEVQYVQSLLKNGGLLKINSDLASTVDKNYHSFVVSNSESGYFPKGSVINWIASYGWKLNSSTGLGQALIFTKSNYNFSQ